MKATEDFRLQRGYRNLHINGDSHVQPHQSKPLSRHGQKPRGPDTRHSLYNKLDAAKAYMDELRKQHLKPHVNQLDLPPRAVPTLSQESGLQG